MGCDIQANRPRNNGPENLFAEHVLDVVPDVSSQDCSAVMERDDDPQKDQIGVGPIPDLFNRFQKIVGAL